VSEAERRLVLRDPLHLLSFGLGSGLIPFAPGSFGTLVAVPVVWFLHKFDLATYCAVTLLVIVFGAWCCGRTAAALKAHDHRGIVLDEVAGYLVTMVAVPATAGWLLAGFVIFRAFDVFKPWPIGWLDRTVKGGAGIMLDDVLAGVYAAIALFGIRTLWP